MKTEVFTTNNEKHAIAQSDKHPMAGLVFYNLCLCLVLAIIPGGGLLCQMVNILHLSTRRSTVILSSTHRSLRSSYCQSKASIQIGLQLFKDVSVKWIITQFNKCYLDSNEDLPW